MAITNPYYEFTPELVPGTKARAEDVNRQFQALQTAFDLLPGDSDSLTTNTAVFAPETGSGNAYVVTMPDTRTSNQDGDQVVFFATHTNTGAATLAVDAIGAVALVNWDGDAFIGGEIISGRLYTVRYDAANTRFVLEATVDAALQVEWAEQWAQHPEDVPVPVAAGGDGVTEYSARHWALKSQASAATGRINTDIPTATPPTTEAVTGNLEIWDSDNTDLLAQFGFNGNNFLRMTNLMRGGWTYISGLDSAGNTTNHLIAFPENALQLYSYGPTTGSGSRVDFNFPNEPAGNVDARLSINNSVGGETVSFGVNNLEQLTIQHYVNGGILQAKGFSSGGAGWTHWYADPSNNFRIYHKGNQKLVTSDIGIDVRGSLSATPESGGNQATNLYLQNSIGTDVANFGYVNADLRVANFVHGGTVYLTAETTAGAASTIILGDPDGETTLYHAGVRKIASFDTGMKLIGNGVSPTPPTNAYTDSTRIEWWDSEENDMVASIGFGDGVATETSNTFMVQSNVRNAAFSLRRTNNAGTVQNILNASSTSLTLGGTSEDINLSPTGTSFFTVYTSGYVGARVSNEQVARSQARSTGGWLVSNEYSSKNTTAMVNGERTLTQADLEAGQYKLLYGFTTSITAADPTNERFKVNNATTSLATEMYINDLTKSHFDANFLLSRITTNDLLIIGDTTRGDVDHHTVYRVTGPSVDNTGWYTIPIEFVEGVADMQSFSSNDIHVIEILPFSKAVSQPTNPKSADQWLFNTDVIFGDPGTNYLEFNNTVPANVTTIYFNDTALSGLDAGGLISGIAQGELIYIYDPADYSTLLVYRRTGTLVDHTGFWGVQVDHVSGTTLPSLDDQLVVEIGPPVLPVETVEGRILAWNDTDLAWEVPSTITVKRTNNATTGAGIISLPQIGDQNERIPQLWLPAVSTISTQYAVETATNNKGFYLRTRGNANPITHYWGAYASLADTDLFGLTDDNELRVLSAAKFLLGEKAGAGADVAAYGQVWVRSDTPNTLMFTDDAGNDFEVSGLNHGGAGFALSGYEIRSSDNTDSSSKLIEFTYSNSTARGQVGFSSSYTSTDLQLNNLINGGSVVLRANNSGGTSRVGVDFNPQAGVDLYHTGTIRLSTISTGVQVDGGFFLQERSNAETDTAGYGQLWIRTATPNELWFTDDTGQDFGISVLQHFRGYSIRSTNNTPSGTTQTLSYNDGPAFEVDLESVTGDITITLSNAPTSGRYGQMVVKVTQDSATARTITWAGGTFEWDGGTPHPMTSTLDGWSIFRFETWDGGTTWYAAGADYS